MQRPWTARRLAFHIESVTVDRARGPQLVQQARHGEWAVETQLGMEAEIEIGTEATKSTSITRCNGLYSHNGTGA